MKEQGKSFDKKKYKKLLDFEIKQAGLVIDEILRADGWEFVDCKEGDIIKIDWKNKRWIKIND